MTRLLFTVNPGLEDVAAEEIRAEVPEVRGIEEKRMHGRVVVDTALPVDRRLLEALDRLRSIHRASILLASGTICGKPECLEVLGDAIAGSGLDTYITPATSFAVRAYRHGDHKYTSMDVARVAGDAVIRLVSERWGSRPEVSLNHPSVVVGIHVVGDEFYVALELSGDISGHRRGYRIYDHPAALKPTIAYAMLVLGGARDGEVLVDPMCGGGTIAIEAGMMFEDAEIVCIDKNPRHINGARLNAAAARLDTRIRFVVGDARRLEDYVDHVDRVVSNPPYGIRMGDPRSVRKLYSEFLESLSKVLVPGGTATLITTEHQYVVEKAAEAGMSLADQRIVAHGDLWVKIVVLRRET